MEIRDFNINDLIPADYNPRQSTEKQEENLKKSLSKYGIIEPIIVNSNEERKNIIIGGHFRVRELKKMGYEKVPCVVVDLNIEDEKELNIRLNKNTGDFDLNLLNENFEMDDLLEWGFEEDDLSLEVEEISSSSVSEDSIPEMKEESKTKKGDLYELGNHRLLCGDSTLIEDFEKLMQGEMADMVFTDPPYNINYDFNNNGMVETGQRSARFGKIKNDNMDDEQFNRFIYDVFTNIHTILKEGSSYYISGGRESTQLFNSVLEELDYHIQSWLIWKKENFNISRLDYHPKHEVITYGWKKGEKHNWYSDRSQTDVLEFSREIGTSVHPTQKSIELLEYLIQNSSKKNNLVVDFFGGSGSTLIACQKTNRKCNTIELDESYCDIIVSRYKNYCIENEQEYKIILNGVDITEDWEV